MSDRDDDRTPIIWQSGIARSGYWSAILLAAFFAVLVVIGILRYSHWIWSLPLLTVVLCFVVNNRLRHATSEAEIAITGAIVVVLLGGSAALLQLAITTAR